MNCETIGIIGLGYVGLPLLYHFNAKGLKTIGFDIDLDKINKLQNGKSYINHIPSKNIVEINNGNNNDFTVDFERLKECSTIIICVPTPLNTEKEPDLNPVIKTAEVIAKYLCQNQLIVLESTTYPGTMEEVVIPILQEISGLEPGEDFSIAYSPEREDPGNKTYSISNTPKVIGGFTSNCLERANNLYSKIINHTVLVSDLKTAEAVKITENIFRAVNIGLVNELKLIFSEMKINVHEVLEAADSKPFGFMKFTPGPGIGGHCIPVDPLYLAWKAKQHGLVTRMINLADEINSNMPFHICSKLEEVLKYTSNSSKPHKILIVGIAYKADIDDYRESPSLEVIKHLHNSGYLLEYNDNYIQEFSLAVSNGKNIKLRSYDLKTEIDDLFDATIVMTDHNYINYGDLDKLSKIIIDTRNIFKNEQQDKLIRL